MLWGTLHVSRLGRESGRCVSFQARIVDHCSGKYSKPQLGISFAKMETPTRTTGLLSAEDCVQTATTCRAQQHQDGTGRVQPARKASGRFSGQWVQAIAASSPDLTTCSSPPRMTDKQAVISERIFSLVPSITNRIRPTQHAGYDSVLSAFSS